MERNYIQESEYLKAEKRVKKIKGFYTHVAVTPILVPFIIFINLQLNPQFHWFWIWIAGWIIGVFIHWLGVFGFTKLNLRKDWLEEKIKEEMNEGKDVSFDDLESNYIQERAYMQAKKRMKEEKGFYVHLAVSILSIVVIIFVNLEFVPGFHFFWYAVAGILLAVLLHWFGAFGISKLGLGKEWEKSKIKEIMNKNKKLKYESNEKL